MNLAKISHKRIKVGLQYVLMDMSNAGMNAL